ncbi:MAG: hypothetical protein HQL82_14850 [Magnetococcales bacterium]|nr:hypothetical protein [Magnetococcales bacterium]
MTLLAALFRLEQALIRERLSPEDAPLFGELAVVACARLTVGNHTPQAVELRAAAERFARATRACHEAWLRARSGC